MSATTTFSNALPSVVNDGVTPPPRPFENDSIPTPTLSYPTLW
jgi:hypothetical protein